MTGGTQHRWGAALLGATMGLVIGAVGMLAVQGGAASRRPGEVVTPPLRTIERSKVLPDTMLAWTPGQMPAGFRRDASRLAQVDHVAVVRSGVAWLTQSRSDEGAIVDRTARGSAIPLEVAGVGTREYRPFVPPADRAQLSDLARGRVILGASAAELRGLASGAVLRFGQRDVRVAGVWPDELLGAHEVLSSRRTAARLGIKRPRYALVDPRDGVPARPVARALESLVSTRMQIRRPGETPYFRHGDAVLPPVSLKELFGEFAARPAPGGYLKLDRDWMREHLETRSVPLLGRIRCNAGIMRQLEGALSQIRRSGLGHLIRSSDGCFSPRYINRDPALGISHHSWGVALDFNAAENPFGHTPRMNGRIVEIFRDWGFTWGGTWVVPDGMHFEFQRSPS